MYRIDGTGKSQKINYYRDLGGVFRAATEAEADPTWIKLNDYQCIDLLQNVLASNPNVSQSVKNTLFNKE